MTNREAIYQQKFLKEMHNASPEVMESCDMAIKSLSVDYEGIVKEIKELPHGEYKDDYGKGFSAAVHAVLKIVAEYIKI